MDSNNVIAHFNVGEDEFAPRVSWKTSTQEDGPIVGEYTDEGDLVVWTPLENIIYHYYAVDANGDKTSLGFAKWQGSIFVDCDENGNLI